MPCARQIRDRASLPGAVRVAPTPQPIRREARGLGGVRIPANHVLTPRRLEEAFARVIDLRRDCCGTLGADSVAMTVYTLEITTVPRQQNSSFSSPSREPYTFVSLLPMDLDLRHHSTPTRAPFSATERFINRTTGTRKSIITAKIQKQSK